MVSLPGSFYFYTDWLLDHEIPAAVWLPRESVSDDHTLNITRYAFRASPQDLPQEFLPAVTADNTSRGPSLYLTFDPILEIQGIQYDVEVSSDLVNWERGPDVVEVKVDGDAITFIDRLTYREDARFMRFLIEGDQTLEHVTFVNPDIENQVRDQVARVFPEFAKPQEPITLSVVPFVEGLVVELQEGNNDLRDLFFLPGLRSLSIVGKGQTVNLGFLGRMDGLRFLIIDNVEPADFSFLANLTSLRELSIIGNQFNTASLNLLAAEDLEKLVMIDTQVNNLNSVGDLANLEILNINATPVSDLSPLSGISALQEFSARGTSVSDLTPLNAHSDLRTLNLRNTNVTSIAPLVDLANLEILNLRDSSVSNLQNVWTMTSLETLDLRDTTQLTNIAPLEFAHASSIDIRGSGVDWCSADTALIIDSILNQQRSILFEECDAPYNVAVQFVGGSGIFDAQQLIDLTLRVDDDNGEQLVSPFMLEFEEQVDLEGNATLTPLACSGGGWRFHPTSLTLDSPPPGGMVTFEVSRVQAVEGQFVDPEGNPISDIFVLFTPPSGGPFIEISDSAGKWVSQGYPTSTQLTITIGLGDWVLPNPLVVQTPFAFCSPIVLQPTPAPATSRIAFLDGQTLYTVDPDGTNRQEVTSTGLLFQPSIARWAPDGNSILFTGGADVNRDQLRRVTLSTSNVTTVYSSSSRTVYDGDQSPNGDILFSARNITGIFPNNPFLLYSLSGGSGSASNFMHSTGRLWKGGVRYSPNGSQIAFSAANGDTITTLGTFSIFTANANGTGLSGPRANGSSPDYDSTGTRLAFRASNGQISILNLSNNSTTNLTPGFSPTWSPDDEWIAFSLNGSIYKIRSNGTGSPVFITTGASPDWSPEL